MYSTVQGNGVAKGLICMTHIREQWWGHCLRECGVWSGGGGRGKNQDNCNSIINKIYLKKKQSHGQLQVCLALTILLLILLSSEFSKIAP